MTLTLLKHAANHIRKLPKKIKNVLKKAPVRRQEIDREVAALTVEKQGLKSGNPRLIEIDAQITRLGKERDLTMQFVFYKED